LINEKREWLRTLEDKSEAELIIVPNHNIQTPEYSIRRVRDDELELPENKQLSYLMPAAPEVAEPGGVRDKKPASEAPAVAALLPATAAPILVQPPAAAVPGQAPSNGSFWARLKRLFSGEPASASVAAPEPSAGSPASPQHNGRRDYGEHRRDGRRDHTRQHRHADPSWRRERNEGRGGDGRDRDRNRDRDREQGRRPRSPERRPDRETQPNRVEPNRPEEAVNRSAESAMVASATPGEVSADRQERADRPDR